MIVFRFAWWTFKATLTLAAILSGAILLAWALFAFCVWRMP